MSAESIPQSNLAANDGPVLADSSRTLEVALSLAPAVVLLIMIAVFSFLSGGYILSRTAPVVIVGSLVLIALAWLVRAIGPSRRFVAALACFAASAVWIGLSVSWSVGPDLSWVAFDLALFYLVVLVVAGLRPAGPLQLRLVGAGYLVIAVAIAIFAFLGKALPDVVTHAHTYARLNSPVGYWNALALMMVMAVPIALEAGSRRANAVWLRALAAAALVTILFTFFFAYSRGGYITLIVALVVYFILARERLSALATLLIATAPVAIVLLHLRGLTTLFNATSDDALRTVQGHTLGRWSLVALAVVVVLQVAVALGHRRLHLRPAATRIVGAVTLVVIIVALAGGSQLALASRGGVVHWVSQKLHAAISGNAQISDSPGRIFSFDTGRPALWREGLKEAGLHPLLGTGAGTFAFTNYRLRTNSNVVKHAHSEWINSLSETGIVGLTFLVAALGVLLVCVFRRLRRDRGDPRRSLVAAMQAACLAFVLHLTWDWTWDMAAVGVTFLLMAGTVSAYLSGRGEAAAEPATADVRPAPGARAPSLGLRALFCGVVVLLMVSWLLPYLGDRAEAQAAAAAGRGQLTAAAAAARRSHSYDPLAVDPLITLALVQQQQGQPSQALATLYSAQRLQPQNYRVHQQIGMLLINAFGNNAAGVAQLRAALALNPYDVLLRLQMQAATQP